jgi:hypothetical protein
VLVALAEQEALVEVGAEVVAWATAVWLGLVVLEVLASLFFAGTINIGN